MTLMNLPRKRIQLRHICRLEMRDAPRNVAAALLFAWIMASAGLLEFAIPFLGAAFAVKVTTFILASRLPEQDERIGWRVIAGHWVMHLLSTLVFALPGLAFALQDQLPYLIVGQLWLFAALLRVVGAHSLMHLCCWSLLVPLIGAAVTTGLLASQRTYVQGDLVSHIWLTVSFLFFALSVLETMFRQNENRNALDSTRAEAETRLAQLEFITNHDCLTGLLNRSAFDKTMSETITDETRRTPITLFAVDLDGFKPINDAFGHEAGDTVLKAIGARLMDFADDTGAAARLGGDEFALMRPDLAGEASAMNMARQIVARLEEPVIVGEHELKVGASIGVSVNTGTDLSVAKICSEADQAMYRAKAHRGGEVVLYDARHFAPRLGIGERALVENALQDGHIRPFYQAKVRLSDGKRHGYEALARWVEPNGNVVSPAEFLPKIDELSLQREFSNRMATRVFRDTGAMIAAGINPGRVSLNVSEVALATQTGLHEFLSQLRRYPDIRKNLVIEITEDVVISRSADSVVQAIETLAEAGLEISLDDFGTGYASFQHLRQLRFNELKIDLSFVSELGQNATADVIVEGFLSIARGLGARVVAEGIETPEQARLLTSMGCQYGQGFLYGRPVDIARDLARLRRQGSRLCHDQPRVA